ncbi:MAG: PSP1 domain-containing protein [Candidatus Komeilibacteria bacterium]
MDIIEVQFTPWDQSYYFSYPEQTDRSRAVLGNKLVVKTSVGLELGTIIGLKTIDEKEVKSFEDKDQKIVPFIRIANDDDIVQADKLNKDNNAKIQYCQQQVKKHQLAMKLVDCYCSFDDNRLTFAFIADGRVDFRNLVKELTKYFKKTIRLQQLGVRDEAKLTGDVGSCGRNLCCQGHLKSLGNVSTEFAKDQMIAHRGSDRLSGQCGRLKCCLAYEEDFYKEELKDYPRIGDKVKTKSGTGYVIGLNILSKTFDVRIRDDKKGDTIVKVDVK